MPVIEQRKGVGVHLAFIHWCPVKPVVYYRCFPTTSIIPWGMPIVFAAIVPHSPVLVPNIGKRHRRKLATTSAALRQLEGELYAAQPQTLAVVSPHGVIATNFFGVTSADRLSSNFSAFGDFTPSSSWRGDAITAQRLRAADETARRAPPFRLRGATEVDYGVSVPLLSLASHLPDLPVLPLHVAGLPVADHWRFGAFLGEQFRQFDRRVAVLASGDLSHRLTPKSPAGFSPRGAAFDRAMLECIRRGDAPAVASLKPDVVTAAAACGFLPIVTILGVMDGMAVQPRVLSYEGPLGVGLLTVHFILG